MHACHRVFQISLHTYNIYYVHVHLYIYISTVYIVFEVQLREYGLKLRNGAQYIMYYNIYIRVGIFHNDSWKNLYYAAVVFHLQVTTIIIINYYRYIMGRK